MDEKRPSLRNAGILRKGSAIRSALGVTLFLIVPAIGQQSPFPQFPTNNNGKVSQHNPDNSSQFGSDPTTPDQKRVRLLNAARQKQIVADTDKLLRLAQELNQDVAESGSPTMTDAQLRKVAEIGKLAKTVKEKMSFTVGGYGAEPFPQTPNLQ